MTATSTTITGIDRSKLSESRYYYAAVRAKNSSGASAWTRVYNTSDFPGDITGLTAQRVSGTITLTWTVPDDYNAPLTRYDVLCSTDSKTTWSHCPGSPFTPTGRAGSTYTATLAIGSSNDSTAYDIGVRAVGRAGDDVVASPWQDIEVPALSSG